MSRERVPLMEYVPENDEDRALIRQWQLEGTIPDEAPDSGQSIKPPSIVELAGVEIGDVWTLSQSCTELFALPLSVREEFLPVMSWLHDMMNGDPVDVEELAGNARAAITQPWVNGLTEDTQRMLGVLSTLDNGGPVLKERHANPYHDDRGRFASKGVSSSSLPLDDFASIAQKVYDEWDQSDEEGGDPELGFGGICQDIAEGISGKLNEMGVDATTVSATIGDQHVWVVAKLNDGVYSIDIPPGVYESGGGYNWQKLPGVQFSKDHIVVDRLSSNPDDFDQYTEEAFANPYHDDAGRFTSKTGADGVAFANKLGGAVGQRACLSAIRKAGLEGNERLVMHGTGASALPSIASSGLRPAQGAWVTDPKAVHFTTNGIEAVSSGSVAELKASGKQNGVILVARRSSLALASGRRSLMAVGTVPPSDLFILKKNGKLARLSRAEQHANPYHDKRGRFTTGGGGGAWNPTDSQREALYEWQDDFMVADEFRSMDAGKTEPTAQFQELKSMIESAPRFDGPVYRGLSGVVSRDMAFLRGSVVQVHGMSSGSTSYQMAAGFAGRTLDLDGPVPTIRDAPKGSSVVLVFEGGSRHKADIRSASQGENVDMSEIIIQKSKWKVRSARTVGDVLEVVLREHATR